MSRSFVSKNDIFISDDVYSRKQSYAIIAIYLILEVSFMKQTEWKIIYTKYEGVLKQAIKLLSKEAGRYIIRHDGVYTIYVLPCEREGASVSKNAFLIGCYADSPKIQSLVDEGEITPGSSLVKVVKNPDDEDGRLVILTGHTELDVFYAVVDFLDDYIPENAPLHGSNRMPELIFDSPLPEYSKITIPENEKRSIFTWGHSFNNYREYIDNMARMKLNEVVIWNDFVPLNIDEIIDYAHSYGIKVILGYSWGWKEIGGKAKEITDDIIERTKKLIIKEYIENYKDTGCDGIYFQSFTERKEEVVAGRSVSALVTDMVNDVADELWKITPDLRLAFGLHATSVRSRLDDIARVDPRVEIWWEDCGEFPYSYNSFVESEEGYKETLEFTKKLLELRGGVGVCLVFKGVMMLDWTKFVFQPGVYVMGEGAAEIARHDRRIRRGGWSEFSADWIRWGDRAQEMLRFVKDNKLSSVETCIAGTFDGGMYLPLALMAEMFVCCDGNYSEILKRVSRRSRVVTN